jgi:hypothetical protein
MELLFENSFFGVAEIRVYRTFSNKKKRPRLGPPFSKRRVGRESEETQLGAASGEETTGEKFRNDRSVPQGCGLFITRGLSICGTKTVKLGALLNPVAEVV